MTYVQDLQRKIKELEDGFDIKTLEVGLLESEMQDTLQPTLHINRQFSILNEMLKEIIDFEKKKPSDKVTYSKNRVLKLIELNNKLGNIMYYNHSLKLYNRELLTKIQLLRVTNADLKKSLSNKAQSDNF